MSYLRGHLQSHEMTENSPQRDFLKRNHKANEIAKQTSKCAPAAEINGPERQPNLEFTTMARSVHTDPIIVSMPVRSITGESSPRIRIEGSLVQGRPCKQTCLCQCHKVTTFATWNAINSILGKLSIGYVGLPLLSYRKCNRVTCQSHGSIAGTRIRIAYLFPLWFALRLWVLTIWKTSTAFMWKLDFPVVIQTAAPVYVTASLGDITELQTMLGSNSSLLNAVDVTANKSPLQVGCCLRLIFTAKLIIVDAGRTSVPPSCSRVPPLTTRSRNA